MTATQLALLLATACLGVAGCGARTGLPVDDEADAAPSFDTAMPPVADTRPADDETLPPPPFDAPGPDTGPICVAGPAPTFGGLAAVDDITEHTAHLHWLPASDPPRSPSTISYVVFASAGATPDFTHPVATTAPGALDFVVSGLKSNTQYAFGVRARDCAGVQDANEVQLAATTLVSFKDDIEPELNHSCAMPSCHSGSSPPSGLNLSHGLAYGGLMKGGYVVPGDASASLLYRRILGIEPGRIVMPPLGLPPLSDAYKALLKLWIEQGARP